MRATLMYGAGDVRVETVPDAALVESTDALVRVVRAAVCGSDLWPYKSMEPTETGRPMGHEFIGVVEDTGDDVRTVKRDDLVVSPFVWSGGTCFFCRRTPSAEAVLSVTVTAATSRRPTPMRPRRSPWVFAGRPGLPVYAATTR